MTVGLFWLVVLQSAMWRRSVWIAVGGYLERAQLGGAALEPVRAGFRLRQEEHEVIVRWGIRGPRTTLGGQAIRRLPTEAEIRSALSGDEARPGSG